MTMTSTPQQDELIQDLRSFRFFRCTTNGCLSKKPKCEMCVFIERIIAALAAPSPQQEQLLEVCHESNAVCICGCPVAEHENYGDEGEACEHPEHECLRTSKAVYAVIYTLRAKLAAPSPAAERIAELEQKCAEAVDTRRRSNLAMADEVAWEREKAAGLRERIEQLPRNHSSMTWNGEPVVKLSDVLALLEAER